MLLALGHPALGGRHHEHAASTAPTPASMFLRNRTCPGTSTNASSCPDGSVVKANPRSMVRPRVFSSATGRGRCPVRARTSDDFPWSTCPAVATTRTQPEPEPGSTPTAPARAAARRGSSDGSTVRRSQTMAPASTRATIGGRGPAGRRRRRRRGRRRPTEIVAGQGAAAGDGLGVDHLAPTPSASARSRSVAIGSAAMRHSGMASPSRRGRPGPDCRAARAILSARRARASGWRAHGGHQVGPAGDHPGLGAAEQLVAGERDQRRAGGQGLAGAGLVPQPAGARRPARGWSRRAGPSRCRPRPAGRGRPARPPRRLDEPDHAVVGGVDLQDQGRRRRRHRPRPVVGPAGAVGGPDLDQAGAGLGHHVGHPEPAADLDQLAPGHDDLPAPGQGGQHQQHGGGVVVDHQGRLGAAGPGQQGAGVVAAGPRRPVAGRTRGWSSGRTSDRQRRGAERRPAEVGVEHHAGGVDHRLEQGGGRSPPPARRAGQDRSSAMAARAASTSSGWGSPTSGQLAGQAVERRGQRGEHLRHEGSAGRESTAAA